MAGTTVSLPIGVPVGYVVEYDLPLDRNPVGWLPFDGASYRSMEYPMLHALLRDKVPELTTETTFTLPLRRNAWIKAR